jgi:hypothetical protein
MEIVCLRPGLRKALGWPQARWPAPLATGEGSARARMGAALAPGALFGVWRACAPAAGLVQQTGVG